MRNNETLVFDLTFVLISFSAFMGPTFFKLMDCSVNNTSNDTVTAFDATSLFANSILVSIFAYMSIEMVKK